MIRILLIFLCVPLSAQVGRFPIAVSTTPAEPEQPTGNATFSYAFNGDLTDEMGGASATAVETITYEGDTCLIYSETDGDDGASVGNLATRLEGEKDFSVSYRIFLDDGITNANHYVHGNSLGAVNTGYYVYFDCTGTGFFNWTAACGNGVSAATATMVTGAHASEIADDTWYDIVEVWDYNGNGNNVYVELWVDGVMFNSADTVITSQAPMDLDAVGYFGNKNGGNVGLRSGDKLDEFRFYPVRLSPAQIAELEADPYSLPTF